MTRRQKRNDPLGKERAAHPVEPEKNVSCGDDDLLQSSGLSQFPI